ncbi:MAG: copper amine oxidase N-terminal domain-containing protein [Defluviitaleaceae bacterium]|nr:copper amine oxidase N-terminal domain-containing protein [Defluviitaleaceae bacterium]
MLEFLRKMQLRGMVTGFVLGLVVMAGVTVLASTVSREITYGVRVNLNGRLMQFDEDSRPFVMEGRTFLPLRALADAMGMDVSFNPDTNTAYLNTVEAVTVNPVPVAPAPSPDSGPDTPLWETADARVFTGDGDDVVALSAFPEAYVFVITGNDAARHFSVRAHGYRSSLLVNTTAAYHGITYAQGQDTETLEITATGNWTIVQKPLSATRSISAGETITGNGDEILRILSHGQTATVEGNSAGRHFAVRSHGARRSLLVNTTNEYSGRVMLRGEYTMLEVTAVGDWTIAFE